MLGDGSPSVVVAASCQISSDQGPIGAACEGSPPWQLSSATCQIRAAELHSSAHRRAGCGTAPQHVRTPSRSPVAANV